MEKAELLGICHVPQGEHRLKEGESCWGISYYKGIPNRGKKKGGGSGGGRRTNSIEIKVGYPYPLSGATALLTLASRTPRGAFIWEKEGIGVKKKKDESGGGESIQKELISGYLKSSDLFEPEACTNRGEKRTNGRIGKI